MKNLEKIFTLESGGVRCASASARGLLMSLNTNLNSKFRKIQSLKISKIFIILKCRKTRM